MENDLHKGEFPLLHPDKIYTVAQLAHALGMSELTIRRKSTNGELPSRKLWRRLYFSGKDVIRVIQEKGVAKGDPSDWV